MRLHAASLPLLSIAIIPAFAQPSNNRNPKLDAPERRIVRLSPTAFPELPKEVVRELQRRGCTVPQSYPLTERSNVIRGEFARPGQTDWAVVCSAKGISSVLVFWSGTDKVAEIGPKAEDKYYLASMPDGSPIYQRTIRAVGRKFIMDHYKAYGGPKPPPIDHEGIDEAFLEKVSVIHYFYRGKWLKLQGAD